MRGVHLTVFRGRAPCGGSSPHARGPLIDEEMLCDEIRFIPACAGSTIHPTRPAFHSWVHPRMRGVHLSPPKAIVISAGSSPHARGPHIITFHPMLQPRFIPACAGSTEQDMSDDVFCEVHPRMRGVHLVCSLRYRSARGSSPHARGPRAAVQAIGTVTGFIPACAGSTRRASRNR